MPANDRRQVRFLIYERNLINAFYVDGIDHAFFGHVCKERDLGIYLVVKSLFAATEQDIRLDTDLTQLVGTMLRRFGLQLASGLDVGHVGEQDIQRVLNPEIKAQLTHSLQKRQALDVANCASDLGDHDVFISG